MGNLIAEVDLEGCEVADVEWLEQNQDDLRNTPGAGTSAEIA